LRVNTSYQLKPLGAFLNLVSLVYLGDEVFSGSAGITYSLLKQPTHMWVLLKNPIPWQIKHK